MTRGTSEEGEACDRRAAEGLLLLRLRQGEEVPLALQGLSMGVRTARAGGILVRALEGAPRLGEIVVRQAAAGPVAHRLVGWTAGEPLRYLTKGDGCFVMDEPLAVEEILGRAVALTPRGRRVVPWHWRQPWAAGAARLSRLEARLWPHFNYHLRVVHRWWRLAGWRALRESVSGENQDE